MATDTLSGLEGLLRGLELSKPVTNAPGADMLHNPVDIYRAELADAVAGLVHCDFKVAFDAISTSNEIANGDLVLTLPKLKLKDRPPNMKALGFELIQQFPSSPLFVLPVPDGVHLRFFFSPKTLPRLLLPYISDRGVSYGAEPAFGLRDPSDAASGTKRLLIEFSSPNIGTEFHGSHLRSTILGAHLAALYERMGWHVTRVNYLGDWGRQIGLLAAGWTRFGSEDALAADPLRHLLDVYTQVEELFKPELEERTRIRNEVSDPVEAEARMAEVEARGLHAERDVWVKRMDDGDEEAVSLCRRFRDVSVEQYVSLYARLGVTFDEYTGESQVSAASVAAVEAALRENGMYEESGGAWAVDFKKHAGGNTRGMDKGNLRFRTGATTYLMRDIAAVLDRAEKHTFDKMIYVVSADQDGHFQKVFRALELMGRTDLREKLEHVHFGKVQDLKFEGGEGGHAQLLRDYVDHARDAMAELLKLEAGKAAPLGEDAAAVADILGASALMVQDLHGKLAGPRAIDLTRAATFDAETGPFLELWHARLCAMLRAAAGPATPSYDAVDGEEYGDLLRLLAQYPDLAKAAFRSTEPSPLLSYLFRLVEELALCFDEEELAAGVVPEITASDAVVYAAVRQVLENGLKILGVPVCGSL